MIKMQVNGKMVPLDAHGKAPEGTSARKWRAIGVTAVTLLAKFIANVFIWKWIAGPIVIAAAGTVGGARIGRYICCSRGWIHYYSHGIISIYDDLLIRYLCLFLYY